MPGSMGTDAVAPTCESRFKAPRHTAQAGEATPHRIRLGGIGETRGNPVIYFIYGPDRLLARESALAIAAEFDPDGSNTSWLDGRETSIERICCAVGAASFFGAPRVVIVSDLLARANRESEAGESVGTNEDRRSRGHPGLQTLIAAVPEQHHLIVFEPSMTSVPAAFKSAAPKATLIAGDPPCGAALVSWIEAAVLESQSQFARGAAQRLAETLFQQTWDRKPNNPRYDRPPDLTLLTREIEKLALASHPGPITVEHIATLTQGGPDQRVFRFLDAALASDLRSALDEMERLKEAGEEPAMLLSQLLGQVELSTVAGAAGRKSPEAVARDLGTIAPGRMSAVLASTRRHVQPNGTAAQSGVITDRNLKRGRTRKPEDALLDIVLALGETPPQSAGRSE